MSARINVVAGRDMQSNGCPGLDIVNILMMTNTYAPHIGGVARSIQRFARRYRWLGHQVRIVAPEFDGPAPDEEDVVRLPAVRHFNHTDFSLELPVPHQLEPLIKSFEPDIVHAHHPFLVGGTALRVAHTHDLPLVFTHHTRYEDYTHNVPGDSAVMKRFAQRLATNYANLCDRVFVPSESIRTLVIERGVTAPVSVVPTGVEIDDFAQGDGAGMRRALGVPEDAFVVGHLGRLTEEKNIPFLTDAIVRFVSEADPATNAHCVLFGTGPLERDIRRRFGAHGIADRLHVGGVIEEACLADAYHAMDVFAFASTSETQGMVITEAMASGVPVVALDAPGVREIVEDRRNGHLLGSPDIFTFAAALADIARFVSYDPTEYDRLSRAAVSSAARLSMERTAETALEYYSRLRRYDAAHRRVDRAPWSDAFDIAASEWELFLNTLQSAAEAIPRK